jgi:hypothetical protein
LSVRLIQLALRGGWKAKEDLLRLLPGPTIEEFQVNQGDFNLYLSTTQWKNIDRLYILPIAQTGFRRNPVTLVFYIGGITFTELAALRFLSQHEGNCMHYLLLLFLIITIIVN